MTVCITNAGLLDHTIERIFTGLSLNRLIVYISSKNKNIVYDVNIKLKVLPTNLEIILIYNRGLLINSFITLSKVFNAGTIVFDDFSGKDSLSLVLLKTSKKVVFLHDVVPHLGEKRIFDLIKPFFYPQFRQIRLCSEYSFNEFIKLYPNLATRSILSALPSYKYSRFGFSKIRVNLPDKYLLFFGRVSKYKGIENFLTWYDFRLPLIIVGKGDRIDAENVIHINEFVPVTELNTYIRNSSGVIIPYLEATQSGVLAVLRGFAETKVFIRKIPAFSNLTNVPLNWYFYDDERLNEILDSI
jgi:hypothetical protein